MAILIISTLNFLLSDLSIAKFALFWLVFSLYIFFHSFHFSLCVSLACLGERAGHAILCSVTSSLSPVTWMRNSMCCPSGQKFSYLLMWELTDSPACHSHQRPHSASHSLFLPKGTDIWVAHCLGVVEAGERETADGQQT